MIEATGDREENGHSLSFVVALVPAGRAYLTRGSCAYFNMLPSYPSKLTGRKLKETPVAGYTGLGRARLHHTVHHAVKT